MTQTPTPSLALLAIGLHLPFAKGFADYDHRRIPPFSAFDFSTSYEAEPEATLGHQFPPIDKTNPAFGVPPLFRKAVSCETYLALKATQDALEHCDLSLVNPDKVDVFCGSSLGFSVAYSNALKVEAVKTASQLAQGLPDIVRAQQIDQKKQTIQQRFGSTSHDKVGEMASSMPSRIAHCFKFRGKCQTIDALEKTGQRLLALAEDTLLQNDSEVVILTTVQRFNSPGLNQLLTEKALPDSTNKGYTEGALCLILQPLNKAIEAGHHILGCLDADNLRVNAVTIPWQAHKPSATGFSLANQDFLKIADLIRQTPSQTGLPPMTKRPLAATWQEPIAIVGFSTLVGNCESALDVWQVLNQPVSNIRPMSQQQFDAGALYQAAPQLFSCYIKEAAALGFTDKLDSKISVPLMPLKKRHMDPLQKLILIAFADAIKDLTLPRDNVGIVLGSTLCLGKHREFIIAQRNNALMANPEAVNVKRQPPASLMQLEGLLATQAAEQIANIYKLDAECQIVEAACASSLAAIHNSVRALQSGRYDTVITGGFEMPCNDKDLTLCSAQMMLSPTAITPFSDQADGFTPGDGGGLFILKRLSDAEAAGDDIKGIIKGISGSCDAKSMTAPDQAGQSLAMRKTLATAAIKPDSIHYIEAHGTGTILGDATEIQSIAQVYNAHPRAEPLRIGSIKYHFGHCFAGSGALGLSKLLLQTMHQCIPPTPVTQFNPNLSLDTLDIEINQAPCLLGTPSAYMALNSFGTGGINYHLIMQGYHSHK